MRIGYARVSSNEQVTNLQIDALQKAGCEIIIEEKASGGSMSRPKLLGMLKNLKHGDIIVIYKLDRIARSMRGLLQIAERIEEAGAELQSLTEALDTTNAVGRMIFQVIGAFAEFEREIIKERTIAGLKAAKKRGSIIGKVSPLDEHKNEILNLWASGLITKSGLAKKYGTHISSIKRLIARNGAQQLRPQREQMELLESV
jgi:DNA invertase Pin-like site-specific DNA recombinase